MTHQFKFGDRVRYLVSGTVGVITDIDPYDFAEVIHEDGSGDVYHFQDLELIPHPDTERLDWLAAQDDIDITLGNTVQLKPCLRAHIDAAMQEQAAEAEAT